MRERAELVAYVSRRCWTRIPLAHLAGVALAVAAGALTSASIKHQPGFGRHDVIALAVYLPLSTGVMSWWAERHSKRVSAWLVEDRSPSPTEQRAVLLEPWSYAATGLVAWIGAALVWSGITGTAHSATYTLRVALSIFLGGLTTSGITFLIAEWAYRPITALALQGQVPERPVTPGVRAKLLLAWIIGTDVFLAMIALTFVGRPAHQPPSAAAICFIVGAAFVAGSMVFYATARSLVTPLLELRQSVRRVQRGDLDGVLSVNDGGEIGLLQAGFNQMVSGLRERRILQDLFGRHVGEEVARQALDQGVGLGGERRDVGVVFVDVIGSTALARAEDPEVLFELLNQFFTTIVRVAASEQGWVNKFEGDGALCVFGAPVARDDYALRALRAARTLRRELLALSASHPGLDAAIGVSAGPVVAGNVGAEQRYEYTVIGAAVNEAARLTDEAKGHLGRVLASEEAVDRAGSEATSWVVAGEMKLRGHSEPTLVYEPTSALTPASL